MQHNLLIINFPFCLFRELHESSRSPTPLHHLQQQQNLNSRSKRFSSPPYSDYGCDKVNSRNVNGKNNNRSKRNTHSMNEAIEVLADQVEERNVVSFRKNCLMGNLL